METKVMRIIRIIFCNLILCLILFLSVEFYIVNVSKDYYDKKNKFFYYPTYNEPIDTKRKPSFDKFYYQSDIETNKSPILIIGCSYAFGHGLRKEQTLSYKLSKYMHRDIYNISSLGNSPIGVLQDMDYNLAYDDIKQTPEYVIYIYMYNHPNRIPNNFFDVEYYIENIFTELKLPILEKFPFLKKLYVVKNLQKKRFQEFRWHSDQRELKERYIKSSILLMKKKIEERFNTTNKKTKFIVLVYSDYEENLDKNIKKYKNLIQEYSKSYTQSTMTSDEYKILHSNSFWQELKDNGVTVIKTEDLIGRTMNKPEERLEPDFAVTIHPSEYAWEELVPLIIKKLN